MADVTDSTIAALRVRLDAIDAELIDVLGRRFRVCRDIARAKQAEAIPMMQTGRILVVKRRARELAPAHGLSVDFIERLFDSIIEEACRIEEVIMAEHPQCR